MFNFILKMVVQRFSVNQCYIVVMWQSWLVFGLWFGINGSGVVKEIVKFVWLDKLLKIKYYFML